MELGCGNGALLAFLARQFTPEQCPTLIGVDAADVHIDWQRLGGDPGQQVREQVTTHGRTDFCDMPVANASAHLVASQFAIEYADPDDAWREVARVAASRARVACVLHQAGSRLVEVARDECIVGQHALRPNGVIELAGAMLPYAIQAQSPEGRARLASNPDANAVRQSYNAAVQGLQDIAATVRHGDLAVEALEAVTSVLAAAGSQAESDSRERLERVRQGLDDQVWRLSALLDSALSAAHLEEIGQRLTGAGFSRITTSSLAEDDYVIGWTLEATRGYD